MADFKPTPEQEAIINRLVNTDDNIGVVARAGSGKTSTLVLMADAMREPYALCLAFNKKIATEMQERLPRKCTASTLNALGHRAWGKFIGKRLVVDTSKNYKLLREAVKRLNRREREALEDDGFSDVLKAIAEGKRNGFLPSGIKGTRPLHTEPEYFAMTEIILNNVQKRLVVEVSRQSYRDALKGNIDFDDQILCPTLTVEASFPSYPLTLIDEAQDLSELNHAMLAKIVGGRRVIAVGDPYQAIYAFRGALEESMGLLMERFNMVELKLTVSFRCAQNIIRNVHWRAPDMKWVDNAPDGEVQVLENWDGDTVPDNSAIICPLNAPLFEAALNLLEAGRRPKLASRDVISQLSKILEKLGSPSMKREDVLEAIADWATKQMQKSRAAASVADTEACLGVLASRCNTLGETINLVKQIAGQKYGVDLMTIHKSKGLEWSDVFVLDADRSKVLEQTENIDYVGATRAKSRLFYIDSETFAHV